MCSTNLMQMLYQFVLNYKTIIIAFVTIAGTKAFEKLNNLLMSTILLGNIKKLSPDVQTSLLEGFHATLNHWHPKMVCFSWLGTFCRYIHVVHWFLAKLSCNRAIWSGQERETNQNQLRITSGSLLYCYENLRHKRR